MKDTSLKTSSKDVNNTEVLFLNHTKKIYLIVWLQSSVILMQ